jgi:DegV family protein with EDD domain
VTVRIVTDSTSDLPPEIAGRQGITVVPAYINIGERSFLDGVDLTREAFYESLPDYEAPPTTAAPSSGAFAETYERLAAEGGREILSIHIAGSLSGMMNAARLGAEAAESASVSLFDSEQLSMGLGLLAIVAAEAAKDGC